MSALVASVRVARIVECSDAEGPGRRFALWTQGCSIRCTGCFNPQYWAARGGRMMSASELFERVPQGEVEGVTLLGGEPFEQAEALAPFAAAAQDAGLSVMIFTGFTLPQLRERVAAGDSGVSTLLDATDLLIDGPYLRDHPDMQRPWVGSRNQGFHTLTDRYAHLNGRWDALPDRLEVTVATDGTTSVNGWASTDALETLLGGMRRASEH